MSAPEACLVAIDVLDALELAEICEDVANWVRHAPASVRASLLRHGGHRVAPGLLVESLDRFAAELQCLPWVRQPAEAPSSLSAEEASELAMLLFYVAYRGWPIDPANLHPSGLDELMPKTLATATVGRLLHHAHLCDTTGGESVRLAQATARRGVVPLVDGDAQPRPNRRG